MPSRAAALALCLAAPLALSAQPRPTLDAVLAAEDARARTAEQLAVLRAGAHATSPALRGAAVRALGRLQRPSVIPELAAALGDASPTVRAEAATGLLHAAASSGAADARTALLARFAAERDPVVVGAMAEALGWLPESDTARVRVTADTLAARSRDPAGADAPLPTLRGVAHGLFGLARQPAARRGLPSSVVGRLTELAAYRRGTGGRGADVEVRVLAAYALAAAEHVTEPALEVVLADPDPRVRVAATRAVLFGTLVDGAAAERIARRALADPAPSVRSLAVTAWARRFGARLGCAPYIAAAADPATMVRVPAVDALGTPCEPGSPAAALLDSLAAALPAARGADGGAWHVPAHALVALAAVAPARARARLDPFAASPDFFVRDYAARAAARARDTTALRRLAGDRHPNVRSSALAGLSEVSGHAADDLYVAALASDDSQLLQTAAKALERSRDVRALPALLAALDRVSAEKSETSRDARLALLDRVRELGDSSRAGRLRPYVADFDTLVAAHAADAIGAWTGRRPVPAPALLPRLPIPDAAERAALARARVTLAMADGGVVVFRLFPDVAPTNAARVARMAREGKLDGLTFHRAVLARFVQGGSPGANEYAGWGAYTRDEFGASHRRGAVSMSTRGYDTADGQIVLHTADNFDYDHRYTVIGEIVSGLDVVERMQEGARIRHATVVPNGAR